MSESRDRKAADGSGSDMWTLTKPRVYATEEFGGWMPDFETEGFRGSWEYKYAPRRYGEGPEPREMLPSGISVSATCKKCRSAAVIGVGHGEVQLKCRRCERSEFVDREKLDHGGPQ
jgi:hypothetical protein